MSKFEEEVDFSAEDEEYVEISAETPEDAARWAAKHRPRLRGIVKVTTGDELDGIRFKISLNGEESKLAEEIRKFLRNEIHVTSVGQLTWSMLRVGMIRFAGKRYRNDG